MKRLGSGINTIILSARQRPERFAIVILSTLLVVLTAYTLHYRSVLKATARTAMVLDSRFNSLATQVADGGLQARAATQDISSISRQISAIAERGATDGLQARAATQNVAAMQRKLDALEERIDLAQYNDTRLAALDEKLATIQSNLRVMSASYRPLLLVGDGNSLMFGSGGAKPFIKQVSDILGTPLINRGVRGQNIQNMIDDAAFDIDPLVNAEGVRPILIVWEGLNWLRENNDKTAADYVDKLEQYCRARRAAGWKKIVVVNSAAHNWPSASWKPGESASEINDILGQRWRGFADAMLDVSWLNDPSLPELYQPDQIHLTTKAQARIARQFIALIPDLQSDQ